MSELPAGRELDAEIAEKVMGLTGIRPITVIDHRGTHTEPGTVSAPYTMSDGRQGVQATQLPHYSTDIAAAWEVVEQLAQREAGRLVSIHQEENGWVCWYGTLSFRSIKANPYFVHAGAPTAPLAICYAALRAVSPVPPA